MPVSHDKPTSTDAEEETRFKRQRTALACESCRRRKTRCDGARPGCGVCVDMGFRCVYTRPARVSVVSGQEPENVSRIEDRLLALEQMLRSIVSKNDQADKNGGVTERVQGVTPPPSATNLSVGTSYNPKDSLNPSYTIGADMLASIGPLDDTVDGMGVITFADEVASGYFGPTSNSAFFSHISHAIKDAGSIGLQQSSAPMAKGNDTNYLSRPPSPPVLAREKYRSVARADPVDCFALPPESKIIHLVNLFFTGTGLLFPYIYKSAVFDGLAEMKTTHFYGVKRSWLCLLNTIMAFAICVTATPNERKENWAVEADVFLQRALKLLPNIALKPANLEAFQALLLVTQYLQGTQHSAQTWNLQGLTVQAAFQIGVHCSAQDAGYSPLEQEIRNRCWYMCFILDKTCSMTFGRPLSISNDYLEVPLPSELDLEALDAQSCQDIEPPLDAAPSTVAVYIQSIKLYKILADVIDKVYQRNIKSDQQIPTSRLFQQIISIEPRLATWKAELPSQIKVKTRDQILQNLHDPSIFSPLSTVITLRYLNARTLLHRAMVTRFLNYHNRKDGTDEEWSFLKDFGRSSLEVSVDSAVEMIEIIYAASEGRHRMLTTWWFSIYYTFSSALIVFAAMIIKHKQGLQILRFEFHDFANSLQRALQTLEKLGCDTRIATRCCKYLKKLVQVASTISTASHFQPGNAQGGNSEGIDGIAIPVSDMSDLSPLDLDLGPFVTGNDWDMFTHLMDQEYLGLPLHQGAIPDHH